MNIKLMLIGLFAIILSKKYTWTKNWKARWRNFFLLSDSDFFCPLTTDSYSLFKMPVKKRKKQKALLKRMQMMYHHRSTDLYSM